MQGIDPFVSFQVPWGAISPFLAKTRAQGQSVWTADHKTNSCGLQTGSRFRPTDTILRPRLRQLDNHATSPSFGEQLRPIEATAHIGKQYPSPLPAARARRLRAFMNSIVPQPINTARSFPICLALHPPLHDYSYEK